MSGRKCCHGLEHVIPLVGYSWVGTVLQEIVGLFANVDVDVLGIFCGSALNTFQSLEGNANSLGTPVTEVASMHGPGCSFCAPN